MNKELLEEIKKYIEYSELSSMWEYSSNIVDAYILFSSRDRMPELYFKILELLKDYNG